MFFLYTTDLSLLTLLPSVLSINTPLENNNEPSPSEKICDISGEIIIFIKDFFFNIDFSQKNALNGLFLGLICITILYILICYTQFNIKKMKFYKILNNDILTFLFIIFSLLKITDNYLQILTSEYDLLFYIVLLLLPINLFLFFNIDEKLKEESFRKIVLCLIMICTFMVLVPFFINKIIKYITFFILLINDIMFFIYNLTVMLRLNFLYIIYKYIALLIVISLSFYIFGFIFVTSLLNLPLTVNIILNNIFYNPEIRRSLSQINEINILKRYFEDFKIFIRDNIFTFYVCVFISTFSLLKTSFFYTCFNMLITMFSSKILNSIIFSKSRLDLINSLSLTNIKTYITSKIKDKRFKTINVYSKQAILLYITIPVIILILGINMNDIGLYINVILDNNIFLYDNVTVLIYLKRLINMQIMENTIILLKIKILCSIIVDFIIYIRENASFIKFINDVYEYSPVILFCLFIFYDIRYDLLIKIFFSTFIFSNIIYLIFLLMGFKVSKKSCLFIILFLNLLEIYISDIHPFFLGYFIRLEHLYYILKSIPSFILNCLSMGGLNINNDIEYILKYYGIDISIIKNFISKINIFKDLQNLKL